jgi:HD-GYP domain-containing protein (c-di-GMP phosphodiesterase class II)
MTIIASLLLLGMGILVTVSGEEPRVKVLFCLICLCGILLLTGIWAESRLSTQWAFFAARANMTTALFGGGLAMVTVSRMCRVRVNPVMYMVLLVAAIGILGTVWLTNIYFTGELLQYSWGHFVAGVPRLFIVPVLSSIPTAYAVWLLIVNFHRAHPVDRERARYLLISISFLALCVLDYRFHFGIDVIGDPVSNYAMPVFVVIFGYACLRFRLLAFREWIGRLVGWAITALVLVALYMLILEIARRLLFPLPIDQVLAAVACLAVFIFLNRKLPRILERMLSGIEDDFREIMIRLSDELLSIPDEPSLKYRLRQICSTIFETTEVAIINGLDLVDDPSKISASQAGQVIETEPYRRQGNFLSGLLGKFEVLIPMAVGDTLQGVIALGKHRRNGLYSSQAMGSFRVLGNIFSIALSNSHRTQELHAQKIKAEKQLEDFLKVLASAIESKDKYTGGHVERVANSSRDLAQKYGITGERLRAIYLGALVHDVGKIGIRDAILNKPEALLPDEIEHIRTHPSIGHQLLAMIDDVVIPAKIAFYHQERFDGNGYPLRLSGERIPLEARIVALADYWDAITSDRPYRKAMPLSKALDVMRIERGQAFDPELFDLFMDEKDHIYLRYLQ